MVRRPHFAGGQADDPAPRRICYGIFLFQTLDLRAELWLRGQAGRQLHAQTGLQFVYPAQSLQTVTAQAVVGEFTAEEALQRLVAGSGVAHRFTGEGTAALRLAQDGAGIVLETIVITSEKVERSYLDTFASVGLATEEDITNYHLDDLYDTFNQMANVRAFSNDRGNNAFQIRGLNADGVANATNSLPLISVIIDGATQSSEGLRRGSRGTWDVEQVEVLRGPQSGLYGRNALAGAVIVETNDPTFTTGMAIKGILGDQERRDGAFMVNAPIIDNQLALRVSGEIREQFKDIEFLDPANEELGEDVYRNIRAKLLFEPEAISGLSALFTVSHTFDKPSASAVTGPDFFAREFNGDISSTEFREADVNNYVANISYGIAPGYTLRSVSALIDTDLKINSAPTSQAFFRDDLRDGEDFTQDLRLEITEASGTPLSGVIGVSYGDFNLDTDTNLASDISPDGVVNPIPIQVGTFGSKTESEAVYADLRYKIFDKWSLIGGLRYQHDVVQNTGDVTLFGFLPFAFDVEAEFDVVLPKYGLAYEIDDTQTVAVTASKGYRQGFSEVDLDINPETFEGTSSLNTVDPEFVWSYEIAYRKTTLDKRLTLGVNAFYNKYTDQQVAVVDADSLIYDTTFNVGNSISYGAEIEGRYYFENGLSLFGAIGLLKTEFKEFDEPLACGSSGGSCTGNEFPEAPQLTFSFGGAYKHSSGFFGSASANYTGDYFSKSDVNNLAVFEVENRFIVNAKVGYELDGLSVAVFSDNIFDEQYLTGFSTRTNPPTEASIGDGRTIGVEIKAKF
jgi:iron complex outermembrane receptor protein